ncbi:MAG TPA: fatty acid desaturase, partial [Pyrinomonadaceae bacterium]|nr:fatty acid desaturase [Pyrinomonadaceae bacterium]
MSAATAKVSRHPDDARETMRVLPEFVQPLLTWLTGKPLHDQKPTRHTPVYHLLAALSSVAIGWLLCVRWNEHRSVGGTPLWLLGCLFMVSGARKLQLMIVHQCAHGTFSAGGRVNAVTGTLISTVLIIEPYESYRRGHLRDHHSKSHMTAADPTVRFLIDLVGLRPGMTVKRLWLVMLWSLVSPRFHMRVLSRRLLSQFGHSRTQALLSGLWLGVLTFVVFQTSFGTLAFTFLLPLTVAYNISGCLRLCCEHRWLVSPTHTVQDRAWYAGLS